MMNFAVMRFTLTFLGTILGLALAISIPVTILWKGLPIIWHGVPMCGTLAKANMLDRILYTSCGCALVELILLLLSALALRFIRPLFWKQLRYLSQFRRR